MALAVALVMALGAAPVSGSDCSYTYDCVGQVWGRSGPEESDLEEVGSGGNRIQVQGGRIGGGRIVRRIGDRFGSGRIGGGRMGGVTLEGIGSEGIGSEGVSPEEIGSEDKLC